MVATSLNCCLISRSHETFGVTTQKLKEVPPYPPAIQIVVSPVNLGKDLKHIWNCPKFSDVSIIVDGQTLYGHAFVLGARSARMRDLITKEAAAISSSSQNDSQQHQHVRRFPMTLRIRGSSSFRAFSAMMKFLYTGRFKVEEWRKFAGELKLCAEEYGVRDLAGFCAFLTEKPASEQQFQSKKLRLQEDAIRGMAQELHKALDSPFSELCSDIQFTLSDYREITNGGISFSSFAKNNASPTDTVDAKVYKLHKCILQPRCNYFNGLLSHEWKENAINCQLELPQQTPIKLTKMRPDLFEALVDYMYR